MKRIFIMAIVMVMIISYIMPCFAFDFNQVNLYKKGDCGNLLKYFGNTLTISYVVYKNGNKEYPAYCLNSNLSGAESGSYNVETLSKLNDNLTWRVIINGYPYKTPQELGVNNEYEAFAATKQAVYWAWEERPESEYSAVDSDAGRRTYNAFLKIINAAKKDTRTEPQDIVLNILPVSTTWEIDENESDRVSKVYKVNSSVNQGTCKISLDGELPSGVEITDIGNNIKNSFAIGEEFKITIPIQNLENNGSFVISAKADLKTYPVLYGKTYDPDKQDYAITGLVYETKDAVYGDNYQENNSKIIVYKKENGTNLAMQNVEFQLLDENYNIVKNDLKTDGNGKIVIDNLLPGKYYLKELSTLEGYAIYSDLIEIELHLFEEANVTVYNNKIQKQEYTLNKQEIEVHSNSESTLIEENQTNIEILKEENTITNEVNINNRVKNIMENSIENNNSIENEISNDLTNENDINNRIVNRVENNNSVSNKVATQGVINNRVTSRVLPRTGY